MRVDPREAAAAKALGRRVLKHESELKKELDPESRTLGAIRRYKVAEAQTRGCKGCNNKRLLGWLANEMRSLTGPEESKVRGIVDRQN